MAIIRDDGGVERALMVCPRCEAHAMHGPVEGSDGTFTCATCFAMFRNLD